MREKGVVFWLAGLFLFLLQPVCAAFGYEGSSVRENARPGLSTASASANPAAAAVAETKPGKPRGYLTTPGELVVIMQKASQGKEPYRSAVNEVLAWAKEPWDYKLESTAHCPSSDAPAWIDDTGGIPRLYARALAYGLTGQVSYAAEVKAILERIMTEVVSISIQQKQCRLNFSWGTPELVASADLLEGYWNNQTCTGPADSTFGSRALTSGPCKRLFQNWLVKNPYYIVSYTAERAQSNWGAAATNTTAYIADYLWDRTDIRLVTRTQDSNSHSGEVSLAPDQAYYRARKNALDRMNGLRVEYESKQSCDTLSGRQQKKDAQPVKSQITEKGIIPEDARRQEFCNISAYNGNYENYPQVHLGNNIQQCELMLRRGDPSCYENVSRKKIENYQYIDPVGKVQKTTLMEGRGSIERAIKAIIVDSNTPWKKDSALEVAYRYYYKHHTLPGFDRWFSQLDRPSGCSQDICFGTLTHGFAPGETPQDPPVVLWPTTKPIDVQD